VAEISLRGITKRYPDGTEAVKRISLDIADGEFMILVGPSGCGKSTALRMIAGLEDISEGELRIGGELVNDRAPRDRDIAMVFQNYALYPHMTVRRNMGFALELAGVDRATIRRKVEEAAMVLDLTQQLERKPANLSGGQRQRVAMGRAIVREPKAFLMDEPLSNLDAKLRVQMRTEVSRLQRRLGTTTVYVTHDQTEAMTLGDQVAVMRGGVIQQVGAPETLYRHPVNLFVAGFIGSPGMNFLPATVDHGAVRLALGTIDLDDRLQSRLSDPPLPASVIVGIRPEHFEDAALVGERRQLGMTMRVRIEVVESLGSDVYVHFAAGGERAAADDLDELAGGEDGGGAASEVVARLDAATRLREGETAELWVDTATIHLFDPRDGRRLTR
jgi:multiple sugar transport system ATP-binding protein